MFKKTTSSIACLTIMATSIGALNANASEQTGGQRNDGVWISKYLKIIPMNKATLLVTVQPFQQNLKQSQHKMAIVLDISEWQET